MVWTWEKGLPSPLVCPLQRVTHPEPQGPGLDLALGEFSQKIVSVGLPLAANNSISNSSSKFFLGGGWNSSFSFLILLIGPSFFHDECGYGPSFFHDECG